jgi:uracil-DNA glycosylase family 4
MQFSKADQFIRLCSDAAGCRMCPQLADKAAVLSDLNGALSPKVLFIAEAPGRQGADRTRRPFYGDKSGDNFQTLLDSVGLSREEIFITNAVMCSPRSITDANRRPLVSEIRNCSGFLQRTLSMIDPPIIATLGSVALSAVKLIEPHSLTLRENSGQPHIWNGRTLVPLYHPSPQVIASQRGLDLQLRHFEVLGRLISVRSSANA